MSFVTQNGSLLQDLDDAGLVRRFDVSSERVGVKLADGLHHLIVSPAFVAFSSMAQEADFDVLSQTAEHLWRRLRPSDVSRSEFNFRFLTSTDGSYDAVRREVSDRIGRLPGGRNVDSAVSLDLRFDEPEADVHVQYGVVEPKEAADRLAFEQPPVVEDARVHPSLFPLKSLPDAGLYDEQTWRLAGAELGSANELFDLWSRIRGKAEEVDVSISDRLLGDGK